MEKSSLEFWLPHCISDRFLTTPPASRHWRPHNNLPSWAFLVRFLTRFILDHSRQIMLKVLCTTEDLSQREPFALEKYLAVVTTSA